MENQAEKPFYKKWWFWVIIILFIIVLFGGSSDNTNVSNNVNYTDNTSSIIEENDTISNVYTIQGEQLGEFGKKITLNSNTDMPVDKYLYKLPAGDYAITTTSENTVSISVVKDELTYENSEYPEVLNYVSTPENISGNKERIGIANIKDCIEIHLNEDESICVNGIGEITLKNK